MTGARVETSTSGCKRPRRQPVVLRTNRVSDFGKPLNRTPAPGTLQTSGQNRTHHLTVDIGQPKIAAAKTVGELFMIQTQEVEDRRP